MFTSQKNQDNLYVNFNAIKIASPGYERKSHISLGSIFITLRTNTMPYGLLEN